MKKVAALGLDIGKKRIGVAGCDGLGLLSTGLTTIRRRSFREDVAQFQKLVAERDIDILVVGLPYSMNGEIGFQAQKVQHYADRLGKVLNLPVEYVDERLTSVEAEAQLQQRKGFSSRSHKGLIDRQAAMIILQQWLDHRPHPPSSDEA